jgi:hypothetical protein
MREVKRKRKEEREVERKRGRRERNVRRFRPKSMK